MTTALTFNDVTLSPISHQNSLWIRAVELAHALGYAQENSVSRIYRSNSDEFTPDMTQVIEISDGADSALSTKARIFSLRGCHLVAMFARTPVAKAFRRWVLEVLDKLESRPAEDRQLLPPALRAELKAIVDAKLSTAPADVQGKARAEIWTRFNRHFKIAEYAQLPACRMPEARDYLIEMQMKSYPTKTAAAVPANAEQEIETHCAAMRGLVRQLNVHMDEIFNIARKGRPDLRTPGDRRELALASIYSMEDAAGAIGHNIAILERTAKTTLIAARM